MARAALTALAVVLVLSGCNPEEAGDDVVGSVLRPAAPTWDGPVYALEPPTRGPATVHAGGRAHEVGGASPQWWTHDGRALAPLRAGLALVDPATGARLRERRLGALEVGVTPDAVTVLGYPARRLSVLDPGLSRVRRVVVPGAAMETDQRSVDSVPSVVGPAFTFGDVTWARWVVSSEHEEKTDHGLLRIEGGVARDVARNGAVLTLDASYDGAALLALLGDRDTDRGVGELDPRTGELLADYGLPPGHTSGWRVEDLDKVGRRVAARFEVASDGDRGPGWQTWVYDGRWERLDDVGATRTWWQGGGRVVQVPLPSTGSAADAQVPVAVRPYRLEWRTEEQTTVLLDPGPATCAGLYGTTYCPTVSVPGSLLPPVRR